MGFWTKDQVTTLRSRAAKGASAADIGKAVSKTRDAVIGKCWRDGVQLLLTNADGGRIRDGNRTTRATGRAL